MPEYIGCDEGSEGMAGLCALDPRDELELLRLSDASENAEAELAAETFDQRDREVCVCIWGKGFFAAYCWL